MNPTTNLGAYARQKLTADQQAECVRLALSGQSLRQISDRYPVSYETIRTILRRAGLTAGRPISRTDWKESR